MEALFSFGPRVKIHPEQIFYATASSLAFVNLRPFVPGHVLVCPKRPIANVCDLELYEFRDLMLVSQRVQIMLSEHYGTTNMHFTIQDGPSAGQSVPHVHVHILPGTNQEIVQAETEGRPRTLEEMSKEAQLYRCFLL